MSPCRSTIHLTISVLAAVLMITCSRDRNLAGATTETTNGIVGLVRNSDNTPAQNTVVKLFPEDYDPVSDSALDKRFVDTTDLDGKYSFRHVNSGSYSVLARNKHAATSLLMSGIAVNDDSVTTISSVLLNKSGCVAADFSLNDPVAPGSYLFIPGTDIFAPVKNDGSVLLADVPAGVISELILNNGTGNKVNVLDGIIAIVPGDTVTVEHPFWKYSRRIAFNTTSSGADVAGDVYNFPVLVRLNSGNFDFSHTLPDGSDLMFAGRGNKALPVEIERWDATAKRAEIWVKIDTIFGDDSAQSIMMYWGSLEVKPHSSAAAVFDTADGYQGVWHLGDASGDSIGDATVNRYNGGSPDTARPHIAEGVIGDCRMFNGTTDFITMPNSADSKLNFQENGHYTISAWVLLDTFDNASHCIVSKGYEQYYLRSTYISMGTPPVTPLWEFVEFAELNNEGNWRTSTFPAVNRQWSLLVGVRQGDTQLLYCDGVLVDSTVDVWRNTVARNTTNDLTLGSFAKSVSVPVSEGNCYFRGGIDEVRIISTAKSPDWVRLCYMNQRPNDDRLVVFK